MALSLFATPTGINADGVTTLSQAVDVGSGSNRVLYVAACYYNRNVATEPTISAITYAGAAMTLVAGSRSQLVAGNRRWVAEWYRLLAPTSGSNTLSITWNILVEHHVVPVPLEGGHQTTPTGDVNIVSAIDPYTHSMTTVQANSWILQAVSGRNTIPPFAPTSPATEWTDFVGSGTGATVLFRTTTTAGAYTIETDPSGSGTTSGASSAIEVREATAAGTQFNQSVDGTLTSSGALARSSAKPLAGTMSTSGVLTRQIQRALSGTLTSAGAILRQVQKSTAGTMATAGALLIARAFLVLLAGTLDLSGTITRHTTRAVDGTLNSSGALVRSASKAVSGALSTSGALVRHTATSVAGALGLSGTLAMIRSFTLSLAGTLSTSGELNTRANKVLAGALDLAGNVTKTISKTVDGTLSPTGVLETVKTFIVSLAGTLSTSGALNARANKVLGGTVGLAGALSRSINRSIEGVLSPSGTLQTIKTFIISLAGTLSTGGELNTRANKALSGTLDLAGSLIRQATRQIVGTLTTAGSLISTFVGGGIAYFVDLAGTLDMSGALSRTTDKVTSGTLSTAGAVSRIVSKGLAGALSLAGTLGAFVAGVGARGKAAFKAMFRGMFKGMD